MPNNSVTLSVDITVKQGNINGNSIEYLEIKCWLDDNHFVNLKATDKTSKDYLLNYIHDHNN